MAVLKVRDPADPTGATWVNVAAMGPTGPTGAGIDGATGPTGPIGPSGGPVPTGGLLGQTIVKTGPADMEVGWQNAPRGFVAQLPDPINMGAQVPSGAVNTWTNILTGDITIDPARKYQIYAGIRAIADAGADVNGNIALQANGVGIFDDYFTATGVNVGLWGAWCQQIVLPGSTLNAAAGPELVDFILKIKISIASLPVYLPRITVIDVGPV